MIVADAPQRHRAFFEAFAGAKVDTTDNGISLATPRGNIEVLTPIAFTHRYGVVAPDVSRGARLTANRFAVAEASLMQGAPEIAGLAGMAVGNATVIGADDAMGATLVFDRAR